MKNSLTLPTVYQAINLYHFIATKMRSDTVFGTWNVVPRPVQTHSTVHFASHTVLWCPSCIGSSIPSEQLWGWSILCSAKLCWGMFICFLSFHFSLESLKPTPLISHTCPEHLFHKLLYLYENTCHAGGEWHNKWGWRYFPVWWKNPLQKSFHKWEGRLPC